MSTPNRQRAGIGLGLMALCAVGGAAQLLAPIATATTAARPDWLAATAGRPVIVLLLCLLIVRRGSRTASAILGLFAVTGLLSPYIWQSALWLAGGVLYFVSGGSQAFRLPPRLTSEAGA